MNCKKCGAECSSLKGLSIHLRKCNLSIKEYYDKFLKKPNEGICNLEGCNKNTKFVNLRSGYNQYCCKSHSKLGKKRPNVAEHLKNLYKNPSQVENLKRALNKPEVKESRRLSMIKAWKDPEVRERYLSGRKNSKKNKEGHKKQRIWMLNGGASYVASFNKSPSKPQVELYKIIREIISTAVLEFPIMEHNFIIDIAIPQLKIAIEYDGSYWHQDKEKDNNRQTILENIGWKFIRYIDRIPSKEQIINDMNSFLFKEDESAKLVTTIQLHS